MDELVETAHARLPDEAAVLVAESFSGPVALTLMARHPSKVRCAVLCATFIESPFLALTRLARFLPNAAFDMHVGLRPVLRRFCLEDQCDPALMAQALSAIKSVPGRAVAARLQVLSGLKIQRLCPGIRTPVLILRAMEDRLVSPARYRQLIENLPGAVVTDVAGPHLLLQSRPIECARVICDFVEGRNHDGARRLVSPRQLEETETPARRTCDGPAPCPCSFSSGNRRRSRGDGPCRRERRD